MIQAENVSYGFPTKELYKKVSFSLKEGQHCALIGSNGTGKTTLADLILHPDRYLYEGTIRVREDSRIGYVNQFFQEENDREKTVFQFLSETFEHHQKKLEDLCERMAEAENLDSVFEEYQRLLDLSQAMDGDNYESNIRKQLNMAGMREKEEVRIGNLSGGEYKLLQVMREMLVLPNLLIMDEPDAFLDFENLNGLCELVNSYKGTLLVITHNRYLLNHCFDKILHLEDGEIQEFDGDYICYHYTLLEKKIEQKEQSLKEQAEIERAEKMVERLRANATKYSIASLGRAVHAKQTYLDRLKNTAIKAPFLELRIPKITLPKIEGNPEETVLRVEGYQAKFDKVVLEDVHFELKGREKAAIVGANGTGKTTLFYDIFRNQNPAIQISPQTEVGFLSQFYGSLWKEGQTVCDEFFRLGLQTREEVGRFLKDYCFEEEMLDQSFSHLSGGEQNLLQLARIARSRANLLLLDEPTSHLDLYAQRALEQALASYQGAVLMVSHDFYTIVNCADYILFVDDTSVRRMRIRSFRKKMYETHFSKEYLELEQQKKELENRIDLCLKTDEIEPAKRYCEQLETIILKMEQDRF